MDQSYKMEEELYKKAIEKWGIQLQFIMLIEECAEVQKEVTKLLRKGVSDKELPIKLMEEIADVEIMLEQLEVFYKHTERGEYRKLIDTYKDIKLVRLSKWLKK